MAPSNYKKITVLSEFRQCRSRQVPALKSVNGLARIFFIKPRADFRIEFLQIRVRVRGSNGILPRLLVKALVVTERE
jgi:hypothetical protein